MAKSTYDTIRDRPQDLMDKVDAMTSGNVDAAPPPAPPPPPAKPIVRGTNNPDNKLPDNEGIFHKAVRMFKGG